ncbi:hypothetical protein F5Y18DRAFT_293724 [Xylariaceae sp. FL1019]|nr:hypothetical protein F5Y18DRAFT_293724 [Xylariaceae sp. FL1019]
MGRQVIGWLVRLARLVALRLIMSRQTALTMFRPIHNWSLMNSHSMSRYSVDRSSTGVSSCLPIRISWARCMYAPTSSSPFVCSAHTAGFGVICRAMHVHMP